MSIQRDERTAEEFTTHPVLWGGTDRFLSGWGHARGGASFAFWACTLDDDSRVERWVRSRSDMKNVRQVMADYRPKGAAHTSVYVVREGHPALR